MMRETDELLPTTTARIVDAPKARPRALALTLAVALCAASAIAGVAIPRSSGDGVVAVASSLKADATPVTDASKGVADRFAPQTLKPAHVAAAAPKTAKKSAHGATSLTVLTKGGLVHEVDPAAWARECLFPFQTTQGIPTADNKNMGGSFSNFDLIGMPSGLCPLTLSCSFENCNVSGYTLSGGALPALAAFDPFKGDIEALTKDNGIALNLPEAIAFPKSVAEVVEAVKHAAKHGMPVSVKTSGHNYAGSSTLAGSVNINMRDFPKYSQVPFMESIVALQTNLHLKPEAPLQLPAVFPCSEKVFTLFEQEMPTSCKLAVARGKPAILRIGGGELWDDAYRAVDNANYWLEDYVKYSDPNIVPVEVMGGGAGSVSAAGGWMQGGGLSIGSERVYGFGADQVLELEMVLADGQHVKFGPSKWAKTPGYLYPKTTEVTGYCNANVAAPESEWQWEACSVAVPWEDLWFAVRGGGGGSYGIVVALTYQLHKRRSIEKVTLPYKSFYTDACPTKAFREGYPDWDPYLKAQKEEAAKIELPAGCLEVQNAFADFMIDLLYDPESIGISNETSLNCGAPDMRFYIPDFPQLYCHDGGSSEVVSAWTTYWSAFNGIVPDKMKPSWDTWVTSGITANFLELKGDDIVSNWRAGYPSNLLKSYASGALFASVQNVEIGADLAQVPEGRVGSSQKPVTQGPSYLWSALIPPAFFLQKNDDVHNLVMDDGEYHITGGLASVAQDQMSPLSEIERKSAAQVSLTYSGEYWLPKIAPFWPKASAGTILGGADYNHIGADAFGPLKSDHTKYCPGYLTHAEREEQCVSLQEFVWGTDTLQRLEKIKKAVDPKDLFQCQKCVGFKP